MAAITRAEAFAPASMGNVGVGFDILGLAFRELGDTVIVERREEPGAVILDIQGDQGQLPREPDKNTATVAINAYLETSEAAKGVKVMLKKGLPLGSGLGSSAASAVAGVVATNALFGEPLSREELLSACLEGEALVSGYHADNAGPSLLGGITLITGTDISQIHRLPVPDDLYLALVTPYITVKTSDARSVLPETVPLKTMVAQTASVAQLVDALYRGDTQAMGAIMEQDHVIEPARRHLMPYMDIVRARAKDFGAFGVVISGAGPTLCAVCNDASIATNVATAMQAVYTEAGIGSSARSTRVDMEGARVLYVG